MMEEARWDNMRNSVGKCIQRHVSEHDTDINFLYSCVDRILVPTCRLDGAACYKEQK